MVSAIGLSAPSSPVATVKSVTGLEVQLEQCKQQRTEQESCSSSKTPQGKARLAKLEDKESELKKRLETAKTEQGNGGSSIAGANTPNDIKRVQPTSEASQTRPADSSTVAAASGQTSVGRLDLFV
jgi:hypothetical protein